jgi:hypothetical protein
MNRREAIIDGKQKAGKVDTALEAIDAARAKEGST